MGKIFSLVLLIAFFIFLNIHRVFCFRYKKKLENEKPIAWVKEELSRTNIYIKCDAVSIVIVTIILIVLLFVGW